MGSNPTPSANLQGVAPAIQTTRPLAKPGQLGEDGLRVGGYLRWASEFVVFAVRGKLDTLRKDVTGVVLAERQAHSQKPGELYRLVEAASPGPRLEMFARARSAGYEVWGNEVDTWQPPRKKPNKYAVQGTLFPGLIEHP